jgi:hypothetical protein
MDKTRLDWLMASWLDGELTSEDQVELMTYLQDHPQENQKLRELKAIIDGLAHMEEIEVPDGFSTDVMSMITRDRYKEEALKPIPSRWSRWMGRNLTAACAAVLLLMFTAASLYPQSMSGVARILKFNQTQTSETEKNPGVNHLGQENSPDDLQDDGDNIFRVVLPKASNSQAGRIESFPNQGPFDSNIIVTSSSEYELSAIDNSKGIMSYLWISIMVQDLPLSRTKITQSVAEMGGRLNEIIIVSLDDEVPSRNNITVRLPHERFDEFFGVLQGLGSIVETNFALIDVSLDLEQAKDNVTSTYQSIADVEQTLAGELDSNKRGDIESELIYLNNAGKLWAQRVWDLENSLFEISIVLPN